MDEALGLGFARLMADDFALVREFHDVAELDAIGRPRPRQQEMIGIGGMADRHMAEGIDDVVLRQNAVGGNKIFFDLVEA